MRTLRDLDERLAGSGTPDWYLYLRAFEAGFDALVTRDWHQSGQAEEMWALRQTTLSIVTWRRPQKTSAALAGIAREEGRSRAEVLRDAERSIGAWLERRGESDRIEGLLRRR